METFHKVCQRFLRALRNLGELYASSPLFSAGDKLTNEPACQVLDVGDGSWWQAVKP